MKLLLLLAFLALACLARSAPTATTTRRQLILEHYDDTDGGISHDRNKPHEDEIHTDGDDDDDDDDEETTTTTTTTTRRSTFGFPTRNRNVIPSRRPVQTQRTTSIRTTTIAADDEEQGEHGNEYDGDFKYIRDFRKYVQQLMDDIKKLVRNLTGYEFTNTSQRKQYNQNNED